MKFDFHKRIIPFLKETKVEMGKVTWPEKQTAIRYTAIVIGSSLAVAVFLGGLDFLFSFLINKFAI